MHMYPQYNFGMNNSLSDVRQYIAQNWGKLSTATIAKERGINVRTVQRHARAMNLPLKNFKGELTGEMPQDLFANTLGNNNLPHKWEYGWLKTPEASIFVKNQEDFDRLEDIKADWLEKIKSHSPKYTPFKYKKITDGHLLVVDPADTHIGKLSYEEETGEEYNVSKAIQRVKSGLEALIQKTQSFPIEKIVLVIGNDILHTDTVTKTTTKGTPQDTDGLWFDNYRKAHHLYVECIERLLAIAPVHIVHCPSNHDVMSGFFLAQSIEAYFHAHKNVSFDVTIAHRKYLEYGRNLLGFSHGDGGKETDLMITMAHESTYWKSDKKNPQFRYWYLHHQHHMKKISYKDGEDYIGGTIEYLRAVSASDGWHARNMYKAPQSICAFIHSKDFGQVARITHYFI